jgi:hypothetical protein
MIKAAEKKKKKKRERTGRVLCNTLYDSLQENGKCNHACMKQYIHADSIKFQSIYSFVSVKQ